MMPQKRNPDTLEVIKAKASVAEGLLTSLLSIGKSLFLGYNRDTQWTKYLIMDLVDECLFTPQLMGEIIGSLKINRKEMAEKCQAGFITAPDLLEQLVQGFKVPFRQVKEAMEKAVKYSEEEGVEFVTWGALRRALQEKNIRIDLGEKLIVAAQDPRLMVSRRKAVGGTSKEALQKNIFSLTQSLLVSRRWVAQKERQQSRAQARLVKMEGDS
jgi:argininosuccinate lyase